MLTPDQEQWVLERAYVPEHIVSLMTAVSGGHPVLWDGYLLYVTDAWGVVVGYPLGEDPTYPTFSTIIEKAISQYPTRSWSIVGPSMPPEIYPACHEVYSDMYYTLTFHDFESRGSLKKRVEKTTASVTVEATSTLDSAHEGLILEFLERENPAILIREFYKAIPSYVLKAKTVSVLSARNATGALTALYVVDMAAHDFATYVVGCHSKKHYVAHASDLLFCTMVAMARDSGKKYIHLGLGINRGIRQFKEKWGGKPTLAYEAWEYRSKKPPLLAALNSFLGRL